MITIIKTNENDRIKDVLGRDTIPKVGDFVTIDDDSPIIDACILAEIYDDMAIVYQLSVTEEHDDIYLAEIHIPLDEVIYLDESFVNMNGCLWTIRDCIREGGTRYHRMFG